MHLAIGYSIHSEFESPRVSARNESVMIFTDNAERDRWQKRDVALNIIFAWRDLSLF